MKILIRDAKDGDWQEIIRLLGENWNVNIVSKENIRDFINENNYCLVAVVDGKIVGSICLHVMLKLFWGGAVVGQIEDVIVTESLRGNKIGEKLVQAALEKAQELGCYRVSLSCSENLVDFYCKQGFKLSELCLKKIFKGK